MVLVGLLKAEVGRASGLETILTVQLEDGRRDQIKPARRCVGIHVGLEVGRKGLIHTEVAVVEPFVAGGEFVPLDHKDEFLDRMIEIHLDRGRLLIRCNRGRWRVLDLFNNVLVGGADKTTTLLRIQVDELAPQEHTRNLRRTIHLGGASRLPGRTAGREGDGWGLPKELLEGSEGDVDADRSILESDEREIESWILTEVELEGDQEAETFRVCSWNKIHRLIGLHTADHLVEGFPLGSGGRELGPDLHPFTRLAINLLLTDLKGDLLDEGVTDRVRVGQGVARTVSDQRERHIQRHTAQEIASARNQTGDALTEVGRTVKVHWHGLRGKVSMTAIDHAKETDLGITRQENVLLSRSDQL